MNHAKPLDLRAVRERHGLGGLRHMTVTATDLAQMAFCEMCPVLSELYPKVNARPYVAQRRAEGQREHAKRSMILKTAISGRGG